LHCNRFLSIFLIRSLPYELASFSIRKTVKMHFTTTSVLTTTLALASSASASVSRPWDMKRVPIKPAPPAAARGDFGGRAGTVQPRWWGGNGTVPPSNGTGSVGGGGNVGGGGGGGGGSSWGGSSTGSASGNPADQVTVVTVGKDDQLVFDPPNVVVPVGSHVQFQFYPQNHSVVQADFAAPCVPIANVDKGVPGFFSGFMPAAVTKDTLVFDYKVTSADPVWFYCSQDTHCQGGMVGAINAETTGEKTVETFKKAASKARNNITPGMAPAGVNPPAGGASETGSGGGSASSTGSVGGGGSTGGGSIGGGSTGGSTGGGFGGSTGGGQKPPPVAAATSVKASSAGLLLTGLLAVFLL